MVQSSHDDESLRLKVFFFRTGRGSQPVREWLKSLSSLEKRVIGDQLDQISVLNAYNERIMNAIAAKFSGIRNQGVLLRTYLVSGILAGAAALLIMSRVDSVKVGYGSSYLLQAVLVVILGGVSHIGGKGNILDVIISILMLRVISSGFNIAGFTEYFRNVVWGSLLVVVTAANNLVPLLLARLAERRSGASDPGQKPGCSPPH